MIGIYEVLVGLLEGIMYGLVALLAVVAVCAVLLGGEGCDRVRKRERLEDQDRA